MDFSLTTPFLPTFSLPASNCGFISATISPHSPKRLYAAGNTFESDIKETSILAKSILSPMSSGFTYLILVFSITTTLVSFLSFHANCPCPTSTAYTFFAPFCNIQSVKPPLDAPISMQTLSLTLTSKHSIAFSSFKPPRLTYFRVFPRTSIFAVSAKV